MVAAPAATHPLKAITVSHTRMKKCSSANNDKKEQAKKTPNKSALFKLYLNLSGVNQFLLMRKVCVSQKAL